MGRQESQEDKARRELQVSMAVMGHMEYQDDQVVYFRVLKEFQVLQVSTAILFVCFSLPGNLILFNATA